MRSLIGAGFRALTMALVNGDPLWPATTLFLVSVLIAIVVAAVRFSRRKGGSGGAE
ncbi:hypothetical protein [Streptomyces sp. NPDC059161]|uniref:hypothetical protein n=1 Tax=unclassified Streptomyces TaxID=2593676 RepID=UPI00366124AC